MAQGVGRAIGRWRTVLRWRTFMGDETAVQNLELLAVALKPMGYRCVELHEREEYAFPMPLLWVYAKGRAEDVGAVVSVRATAGGTWAYFEAGKGRDWFPSSCDDAKTAAERVDLLLKYRMFPDTEWA